MESKNIATRPLSIIEAKFDLESKQNDIIDMLLTEIKDDEQIVYELNIDKYKEVYDSDTSNIYRDMKKAVKKFEEKGFHTLINGEETWFAWFTKITYKDREGKIQLKVDPELKELLTEVKQRISYDIGNTLNCVSKYSKRLYYYLKLYEDTGWRIDTIENLCEKLKCPDSYVKSYGKFKEKVLTVAYQEINNITDIYFDYEEIKEGRKIVRLKFNIKNRSVVPKLIENKNPEMSVGVQDLLKDILSNENIIKVENTLLSGFKSKTKSKAKNEIEYLKEKMNYVESKYTDAKNDESSYIALLISALKGDWIESEKKPSNKTSHRDESKAYKGKQLKFNNFEGRKRSPEEWKSLENQLLGWDDKTEE